MTDVADDADDRQPRLRAGHLDVLANRVLIGPEAPGHRLVDHRHARRRRSVVGGEATAAKDRDAHRVEVVVHRAPELDLGQLGLRNRAPLDLDQRGHGRAAQREPRGATDLQHAGQSLNAREEVAIERAAVVRVLQPHRDVHLPGQQVLGLKSRIDRDHSDEAADEQSGAGGERNRQRHLGDDESRPGRGVGRRLPRTRGSAPAASLAG